MRIGGVEVASCAIARPGENGDVWKKLRIICYAHVIRLCVFRRNISYRN